MKTSRMPTLPKFGQNEELRLLKQKVKDLTIENEVLIEENDELIEKMDVTDNEREDYFNKLQTIEEAVKVNQLEETPLGTAILNIMYSGIEDEMRVD